MVYGFYRVPNVFQYDRAGAVGYAHNWAYKRNPAFMDFENFGGDCTNFASQVIYAGSRVMNYTPVYGWYYIDQGNRSPSWTGVDFLHDFLVGNNGSGPFAETADVKDLVEGDIIQLSFQAGSRYNHSPVVVRTGFPPQIDNILVATHTDDRDYYPLTEFSWVGIRYIHIVGVRIL